VRRGGGDAFQFPAGIAGKNPWRQSIWCQPALQMSQKSVFLGSRVFDNLALGVIGGLAPMGRVWG